MNKTVLFLKPHGVYQKGMVATFPNNSADRLIACGIARLDAPATVPNAKTRAPLTSKILKK